MAENLAQEERIRRLRDAIAGRYRSQRDRGRHRRELSDPAVPAERARDRTANHDGVSPLRAERPPDRDHQPGDAETRLLLPVAARQPPVRTRPRRRSPGLHRRILQDRSGHHRRARRRSRPRRICRRMATAQGPRLGRRPSPHPHHGAVHMTRIRSVAAIAAIATSLFAVAHCAAQIAVFDPSNYSQNLMTAANTLKQIDNQLTALQNQTQMLLNQARHLTSLPTSLLNDIDRTFTQTQNLLKQVDRIAYDVQAIEQTFQKYQNFSVSQSDRQLIDGARDRWQNSVSAFQHSMSVGAGTVNNLPATQTQTDTLVGASQSAVGVLQVSQAGHQLLAVQARQLADLTALVAAQGRAQSIEQARQTAGEDQAREQVRRFLTNGQGYQPQSVQMFH